MPKRMNTRVIACISAKGGVGKTTSSINLAAALNSFNKSVTVLDANLTTPDIGVYLGVPIVPVTLHDVLKGKNDVTEAVYLHKSGIRVVPASIAVQDLKRLQPERLSQAIRDLKGITDYIIVDCPPGLTKEAFATLRAVGEVLVVTNPEMPSVTNALKTIKFCQEMKKEVLGVLVTKTNSKNADMPIKDIQDILETPVINIIPEDRAVKFSQAKKDAVIHTHPESAASVQYKKLAAEIAGIKYEEEIKQQERSLAKFIIDWFLNR